MAAALEALVAAAGGATLIMVDPNCRPRSSSTPPATARGSGACRAADVVKVSEEDLAWLAPGVPAGNAARALLGQGAAVVLLTRGGDGAVALTRDGEIGVEAPAIDVVDTIGAGDAFSGGWLAWWSERGLGRADLGDAAAVEAATAFACRVAALTCARAGASPPTRAEVS